MSGFHYITDSKGKRVGVQIDLRTHGEFWEDFYDAWLAKQATKDNDWISWEEAKKILHPRQKTVKRAAKRQSNPVKRSKPVTK